VKRKDLFYGREVKQDSKGLYVCFGGFRFRPMKSKITKAVLGQIILLDPEPFGHTIKTWYDNMAKCSDAQAHLGHVTINGKKEIWKRKRKIKACFP
jgi:hypothetical protein